MNEKQKIQKEIDKIENESRDLRLNYEKLIINLTARSEFCNKSYIFLKDFSSLILKTSSMTKEDGFKLLWSKIKNELLILENEMDELAVLAKKEEKRFGCELLSLKRRLKKVDKKQKELSNIDKSKKK